MNEPIASSNESISRIPQHGIPKPPRGVPKWVIVCAYLVSGVALPLIFAISPQLSEFVKSSIEARKSQIENERTALGTVLELLNANVKQVQVLSATLEVVQSEKKGLIERINDLERLGRSLETCQKDLTTCQHSKPTH